MKELSIEEKAKRYESSLERCRKLYNEAKANEYTSDIEDYETIFPELKDEDERIRKELVAFLEELSKLGKDANFDRWKTSDCANWIAWLEKQGEISTKSVHIADIPFGAKDSELFEESITIPDGYYAHIDDNKVIIKRRGKSKFNVGDWIINRTDATIMQIVNNVDFYESVEIGGQRRTDTYNYVEWDFRLWTIQDAKDEDVLSDGTTIFIFKDLLSDGSVMSYCDYDTDSGESDAFCPSSVNLMCSKITPATKEQREQLEKAIADAGYKWGEEKRELKKIEKKPHTSWHPADGDYLPEIDRSVIVLTQKNPLEGNEYAVSFAHRPPVSWIGRNIITDEKETFYPKRYEKAGWNIPYVKWWLDCDLPTNKQENGSKKM